MAVLKSKIKGTTIIESLVAITLIAMVFGSTLFFFMNVRRDLNQPLKTIASVLVSNEITKLHKNKSFKVESYSKGNVQVDKQIENKAAFEDLNIIIIIARRKDNGRIILERRLLIPVEHFKENGIDEEE